MSPKMMTTPIRMITKSKTILCHSLSWGLESLALVVSLVFLLALVSPSYSNAQEAAGVIHTDFAKGFIRAEVFSYSDYKKYKSDAKVKEAGKMKLEGKDYVVKDGDIIYFRFNV